MHENVVFRANLERALSALVAIDPAYDVLLPADSAAFAGRLAELNLDQDELERGLASGDWLGVIVEGGVPVHRSLVQTRGRAHLIGDRHGFLLPNGSAFIHSCETLSAHRGRGLYPHMLGRILLWLRKNGFQEAWISCARSNHGSVRGIGKAGFELCGDANVLTACWERIERVHWKTQDGCRLPSER